MRVHESSRNIPVSYSLQALTRRNVGRNATSSSPYIKTFSNCYFVDTSVSFKEKQHHFKFHLTWARGTQFGEGPVLAVHLSESVSPFARNFQTWQHIYPPLRAQNYSTTRLLTLRVKFNGISRRTPEVEHLSRTAFIRCIWDILFPIKAPFAKRLLLFWSLHFCLLSSTKSVPMYLLTCWKYKQSHIFISPCRNDPRQLKNCRTKRFSRFLLCA